MKRRRVIIQVELECEMVLKDLKEWIKNLLEEVDLEVKQIQGNVIQKKAVKK